MQFSLGNIPLEELAGLPNFYFPAISHDRQKIAFYGDKSGSMELYIMDAVPGAEPRQIGSGDIPKSLRAGFCWTHDDKHIIFAKDDNGDEQHNLWRINMETGEAEQLTDNPKAQEYPVKVAPDNKTLLALSNLNGQLNLYTFDLETKEYTQLTHYDNPVFTATFSADGQQIAYVTNESDNLLNQDIYLINIDGSNNRRIIQTELGSQDAVSDWSDDGRYLAVATDHFGGNRVGVYDVKKDETRWLTPEDKTIYAGNFSPNSKSLLTTNNEHSAINIKVYDIESGDERPVELPPGLSYNADWLSDDHFVLNIMTDVSRPELRDYHLDDGTSDVLLEADYGSIDPSLFVPLEYVSYPSTDGLKIHAMVYRPRDMEAGKKYPALVEIHGGPTGQYFRGFNPFAQFLADAGYIIIEPNVRGSTGYGVEFRDMCRMDWGGADLEDVEGAANYLRSLPEVANDRVGVWGGSYGGFMTMMALTKKPDLWKVGVARVSVTHLRKMYKNSMEHFKYYLREQMGDPEENAELWEDRSAANFLDQITAHFLMIHGKNDPRCPIGQARIVRDRMLEMGKVEGDDFEYIELEDEGHGSSDIAQKIRSYKILLDYLQRRL